MLMENLPNFSKAFKLVWNFHDNITDNSGGRMPGG